MGLTEDPVRVEVLEIPQTNDFENDWFLWSAVLFALILYCFLLIAFLKWWFSPTDDDESEADNLFSQYSIQQWENNHQKRMTNLRQKQKLPIPKIDEYEAEIQMPEIVIEQKQRLPIPEIDEYDAEIQMPEIVIEA